MKGIKLYAIKACAMLALPLLFACGSKDPNNGGGDNPSPGTVDAPTLTIGNNLSSLDFLSTPETRIVKVNTKISDWTVSKKTSADWLTAKRDGSNIKLTVTHNGDSEVREATIVVRGGTITKEILVRQVGTAPKILVSTTSLSLPVAGGPVDFTVTTNVKKFEIKVPDWVKSQPARAAMVETSHSYLASANKNEASRTGNIEVIEQNPPAGRAAIKAVLELSQAGLSSYTAQAIDKLPDDVKLKIISGTDTSHQGENSDITKAFDGDMNTIYHSKWDNSPANYFPITLTLTLKDATDVDYMLYHPRQSGSNGNFKVVDIYYTADGSTYHFLMTKDFQGSGASARATFPRVAKGAKTFKLVVKSGHGDRAPGFAAAAEIEFYQKSPKSFDYRTLFTDETCSELKAGITESDIQKTKDVFFGNLAYYMLQKKYDTEFRVAEYKPYPHPNVQGNTHKANPYSLLDNPTGISVQEGEELVVLVGNTHGYDNLAIRVVNLDKPGGDGFGDAKTYTLNPGVNRIKMLKKGLVYVMYHINSLDTEGHQPIKIHFASGRVNGYYDKENPKHKGRWTELLNKATDKYFDLVGKYAHMTFEVADYKARTPDGDALISIADTIVKSEMEHLGLYKYNKVRRNRMYMHVMYHSFMYATWYHTGYVHGTMGTLTSASQLRTSYWGPAHEIGHMNQTTGLKWKGMTECTVNISSFHIGHNIFKLPTRMRESNEDRYRRGWNMLMRKNMKYDAGKLLAEDKKSHADHDEADAGVIDRLTPFVQLELYFGDVLGETPSKRQDKGGFYPDVYEYYRTTTSINGNTASPNSPSGWEQTEFAYVASKISGYDLTDFFTKWGFLTPVDRNVGDYGNEHFIVKPERSEAVRQKIKSGNYKALPVALEYITEENVELYRKLQPVQVGTARRVNNGVALSGFVNAVAFEVANAAGEVVNIDYGTSQRLRSAKNADLTWQNGYKLYVVAADGTRTEVTVQ